MAKGLSWEHRKRDKYADITSDVSIKRGYARRKSYRKEVLSITLRNGVRKKITSGERISFAKSGNRVYFREDEGGFKLFGASNSYIRAAVSDMESWSKYFGDYALKFDADLQLYYVESSDYGEEA